jgi:Flp pilus assembly protein TadG
VGRQRAERGAAVVDFVLVVVVVVPLFLGILQVALVLHVRNTLTAAASEGARFAAAYDRDLDDGERAAAEAIDDSLGSHVADDERASLQEVAGQRVVVMTVRAKVPTIALWGPSITLEVTGHAVKETLP